ncbi:MAG: formate dehydrogenase accessory sulfurtransferase FdhD [Syntrophorhabdales bacterium]
MVVEEPLEMYLDGSPYQLTMRLPGEELYLALGYCYSEGIIDSMSDILMANYCGEETGNRIDITLDPKRKEARGLVLKPKELLTYSSCGLCGKEMIEDICTKVQVRKGSFTMPLSRLDGLLEVVERHQGVYSDTGGAHGAAIFDEAYGLLAFSEDVGRHNALDKAIGRLVFEDKVEKAMIVVLTSRLSYEMTLKTGRLGAHILVGFSSPTSLAIDLAKSINLTLIRSARTGTGKVYTGVERIAP